MVATQEEEVLWKLDFVAKEQHDALDRVLAAVDVITNEEIVTFSWPPSVLENLEQIGVLPMDVP
jgi:hypothetical protein